MSMDKYRQGVDKQVRAKKSFDQGGKPLLPINEGQQALIKSEFANREKETFFNDAYADILGDLFVQWLRTAHHEKETREYLYATAMALGSVKDKLIKIETYGKNIPYLQQELLKKDTDDDAQQ